MKKIVTGVLLSTVALSFAVNASAATTDTATTKGNIVLQSDSGTTNPGTVPGTPTPNPTPLTPDPTSPTDPKQVANDALAFTSIPKAFDFGTNKISAQDQAKQSVTFKADWSNYKDGQGKEVTNSLQVYDGRLKTTGTNWRVSASATKFADSTKELTGATIKFNGVNLYMNDKNTNAGLKDTFTNKAFEIAADGTNQTKEVFGVVSGKQAKLTTDMLFNTSNVELIVPGTSLQEGSFEATINWNLDDSAMS